MPKDWTERNFWEILLDIDENIFGSRKTYFSNNFLCKTAFLYIEALAYKFPEV